LTGIPVVSISLNEILINELDSLQMEHGYSGRSELIRAAIRLLITEVRESRRIEGNINALLLALHNQDSEHHVTHTKSKYLDMIHTQLHNKFKGGKCMELFILDGDADRIKELVKELQQNEENDYVKLIVI